jgi:hypothetical protein
MDLSTIFQFLPYASRLAAAAQTIERLEKDPGVQDILKLVEELGPKLAAASKPLQTG